MWTRGLRQPSNLCASRTLSVACFRIAGLHHRCVFMVWVCACVRVHIHTYMHACMHTYIDIYVYIYMYIVHTHTHTHTHTRTQVQRPDAIAHETASYQVHHVLSWSGSQNADNRCTIILCYYIIMLYYYSYYYCCVYTYVVCVCELHMCWWAVEAKLRPADLTPKT